ncbi:MAG: PIG-L deacetylase family protein [Actinomycetota bacterium]
MADSPLRALIATDDEFLPSKVLIIVAHPDDIDFGTAGTVATLTDHGVEVVYGLVTSGQAGEPDDITVEELAALRQAEQTAAAKIVGVSELHWLGFPDGAVVADLELRKAVSRLIRIVQPDLVITQNPERNWDRIYAAHPDHLATGEAVVSAVYPDARNAKSFPELLDEGHQPHAVPRIWLMAGAADRNNLHVDISKHVERKIEALMAHDSQNGPRAEVLPGMIRDWAAANGEASGSGFAAAESFRSVTTE